MCVLVPICGVQAEVITTDDTGKSVTLKQPAQRIISLAPYLTELVYAIGQGEKIVGVVEFSNFPPEALNKQRVGQYDNFDVETIVSLQPDLILAWHTGNHPAQLEKLEKLGISVYRSEPRKIEDIPRSLYRLGKLTGAETQANSVSEVFQQRLAALQKQYSGKSRISGFYQVWHQPVITINGEHIISAVMNLCGIDNIFHDLGTLAPHVSYEVVILRDPQMILASGMDRARPEWLDEWRKWPELQAVASNNLFFIPPDLIQRHSPRILDAAQILCEQGEQARQNLAR